MKISKALSRLLPGLLAPLPLGALLLAPPVVQSQTDNFNQGNDALWTHSDLSILGDPRLRPTYSFPADATNGHAYRVLVPANPYYPQYGPGRAATYRPQTSYTGRFSLGVDFNAWNDTIDQDFGVLWYLTTPGIGSSSGYSCTYGPLDHLRVSQITAESPTEIGRVNPFHMDPTRRYRLVVSSHDGSTYLAQVFSSADWLNPVASVVTADSTWSGGLGGLVLYDGTSPSVVGCDATFDNYAASAPAANSLLTTVVDLYPLPGSRAPDLYPTISVGIFDRDTFVNPASIVLSMDGAVVDPSLLVVNTPLNRPQNPGGYQGPYSGATVAYTLPNLLPYGSRHTNSVAFQDSNSTWQTNTWSWTTAYPFLHATNGLPLGTLGVRGIDARMVQTNNGGVNLDNSLARALKQLAQPPLIPAQLTATSMVQELAWNTTGTPNNVPGICATPSQVMNIAVESLMYLELTAGQHRFHVITDDRAGFYSGVNLADPNATVLWEAPGNTGNTTFDFIVEADGLYPFRAIWEQTGGGAVFNVSAVSLVDGSETLLNDPAEPDGVVHAWYPLVCKSAGSLKGPFAADATAVHSPTLVPIACNEGGGTALDQMITGGTFTLPVTGSARFYRLDGPRATRITGVRVSGGQVVVSYQVL